MNYLRILALLLVTAAQYATAATVTLNPCNCGDDSVQIAQAIITASANGTVAGTLIFNGTFILAKAIDLRVPNLTLIAGAQGGTLDASNQPQTEQGFAIRLDEGSSGLTVRNLTILARNRSISARVGNPLVQTPLNNVTIVNNTLISGFRAVNDFTLGNSRNWVVANNVIRCPADPLAPCGTGIVVTGSNGLIVGNDIESPVEAIAVQNNLGFTTTANISSGNNYLVANNTIHSPIGIQLGGGSGNLVLNNTINTAPSDFSIAVGQECLGITVNGRLDTGVPGFATADAQRNILLANTINASCGVGIQLLIGTDLTQITRNVVSSGTGVTGIEIGAPDPFVDHPQALASTSSVRNNSVTGGAIGIHIFPQASNNTVINNRVSRSVPAPAIPVLQDPTPNTNRVRNN